MASTQACTLRSRIQKLQKGDAEPLTTSAAASLATSGGWLGGWQGTDAANHFSQGRGDLKLQLSAMHMQQQQQLHTFSLRSKQRNLVILSPMAMYPYIYIPTFVYADDGLMI